MECATIKVSPIPQVDLHPTAHPVAKKIVEQLQNDGTCCLFGTLAEVANFLWGNQEFVFGSQSVQASELIDPDDVKEPRYEATMVLDDGTDAMVVLESGGTPSLSSRVGLRVTFQTSSEPLAAPIAMRMGSVELTTSDARWTFVGIENVSEIPACEDVVVRCGEHEASLNLDQWLKSQSEDSTQLSVDINGVSLHFLARVEVERVTQPRFQEPAQEGTGDEHQWRLSIEVRSLKLRTSPAKVFAKYSYPYLEQTRPFRTNPPVMARKNTTIHFPHSFSSYHFPRKKESELTRAFAQEMLRIEVWQRETYTSDSMIGHAFFDLTPIFDQPLKHDSSKPSMGNGFRLLDLVSSVEYDNESKGVLRTVVFLEDLGLVAPPSPPPSAPQNLETVAPKDLEELRDTPAYSTAVELELWKRNEEAKFRVRLQEEERQKKRQLEEEYEEKERVRSLEFHSQKQQMVKLEQTMRLKLQEVMKREQQLQAATVKIKTEKDVTQRQQQMTMEKTALETKLLRHEMDQNVKLDHAKCKKLQAKLDALEEDVKLWRQRYTELEEKFIAYRKSVAESDNPIEKLKAELKIKEFEIQDLHRKHTVISDSRDHFKNAVRTLLVELEKEKKKSNAVTSPRVTCVIPTPQPHVGNATVTLDRRSETTEDVANALQQIKSDLAQLRDVESPKEVPVTPSPAIPAIPAPTPAIAGDWEDVRREMLGSGLYTEQDRMFKYLKGMAR